MANRVLIDKWGAQVDLAFHRGDYWRETWSLTQSTFPVDLNAAVVTATIKSTRGYWIADFTVTELPAGEIELTLDTRNIPVGTHTWALRYDAGDMRTIAYGVVTVRNG